MVPLADWKATWFQKRLVKKVLRSGRLTYGPVTRELEDKFAHIHNRNFGLFTNSGTSALKIVLHAFKDTYKWKDGAEVIMPSVTFVATMNVIVANNLKPVLVDVDPRTVNMDPDLIEKAITKKTKAILVVHLLGQPADMDRIMLIARQHNLKVIEDSCETMFVSRSGQPVGSQGDAACFSTYLAHLMVTGVGGFILTNDQPMSVLMRSMMFHGRDESYLNIDDNFKVGKDFDHMVKRRFYFERHGYSDRATELEAALGLGDLRNWQKMIKKRQDNAVYLMLHLEQIKGIEFPVENYDQHAFMFFPMFVPKRDRLVEYLEARGIHTRHMMPLTSQPIARKIFGPGLKRKYPVADWINQHGILIGCHQYLKPRELNKVIKTIKEFYTQ